MPFQNQDRSLTLPDGAGAGEARIVIGSEIPAEIAAHTFHNPFGDATATIVGGIFFYSGITSVLGPDSDYMFMVWGLTTFDDPIWFMGSVENKAVKTSSLFGESSRSDGLTFESKAGSATSLVHTGGDVIVPSLIIDGESKGLAAPAFRIGRFDSLVNLANYFGIRRDGEFLVGEDFGVDEKSRTRQDIDTSNRENVTHASYTFQTGYPEIVFVVPPHARGEILIMVRADADATGDQFLADVEIYEGTDATGTLVHSPNTQTGGIERYWDANKPAFENYYGYRIIDDLGLTPNATYYARLMIHTNSTAVDIYHSLIRFRPGLV